MILHGDCLEHLKSFDENSVDSLITDPPAGIGFMNKKWDKSEGFIDSMSEIFKECLRVLKPGAHGLVWAIPRTSHKTATALEQAGFEIRDVITHIFGSGFPKSLDISKAVEKAKEAERIAQSIIDQKLPNKWSGFGTALKPATEMWILIRKPISEDTIAKNVLEHGTGGLNIDASRIGTCDDRSRPPRTQNVIYGNGNGTNLTASESHIQGRFPSNLIVDESAVEELDEQSGVLKSGGGVKTIKDSKSVSWNEKATTKYSSNIALPPQGGASRFFYVAKASKSNRGEGNNHPTVKNTKLMEYLITLITPPGGIVLDPFMGSGSTGVAAKRLGFDFVGIEKEVEYFEIASKRLMGEAG